MDDMTLIEGIELTALVMVILALWEIGRILRRMNSLLFQQCNHLDAIANELLSAREGAEEALQ
jgi:hypothetical protein